MSIKRPITFWIATLAALIILVVLLREVLLPFVAGMALAYLLDPLAVRLERLGMNRLIATLTIVASFIVSPGLKVATRVVSSILWTLCRLSESAHYQS